jgi:hypothetical protein
MSMPLVKNILKSYSISKIYSVVTLKAISSVPHVVNGKLVIAINNSISRIFQIFKMD